MLAAWPASEPPAWSCRIERRTTVPVDLVDNRPLVDVAVDGRTATFLLDTGAERTILSDAAVHSLGLARDTWVSTSVRGVGGTIERTANAVLRSFDLGGVPLRRHAVSQRLTFVVAPLPWTEQGGRPIVGLLGADYLSAFDLDLDMPAGTLTLYDTKDCDGVPIPWGPANTPVALQRPSPYVVLAPVVIGDRTLQAQLDTGASFSLVSARGEARLGFTPGAPNASARGVGRQAMPLRMRVVPTARLGPAVYRDVLLAFGSPAGGFPFDMLLGTDLLRRQRIFISYATSRLLVATP